MKIEVTILKCDECTKEESYQPSRSYGIPPPYFEGWIRDVNGVLDFCCASCAAKYFANWAEK